MTETDPIVDRLRRVGCVFAEDEAALLRAEAPDGDVLEQWVRRRESGEPLEVVVGWAELDGVRVRVSAGLFVPRQRSRLLVRAAVQHLVGSTSPVVVDLCCGTGALGLVIATRVAGTVLHAADVDPIAVACAAANLGAVGGTVHLGDLDEALPSTLLGRVDVLVANAPYVPSDAIAAMPPEARDHESTVALDGGDDGLDVLRRVVTLAPRWLGQHGLLVVECGAAQVGPLSRAAVAAGLVPRSIRDDDLGATALVAGQRLTADRKRFGT